MKRSEKEQIVSAMKERIVRANSLFFADFTGVTVEQINELRREFRKSDIDYEVVKNTLARKALEGVGGDESVLDKVERATAVAVAEGDPRAPAASLQEVPGQQSKKTVH